MDIVSLADQLWRGETTTSQNNPMSIGGGVCDIADGVVFLPSFGNCVAFDTSEGLVLFDTGSQFTAKSLHETIRTWSPKPLNTAIFSHGHVDHVFGVRPFEIEAEQNGWPTPRVVAHENVVARFNRYQTTHGYNEIINRRQFALPDLKWPTSYRYPDVTYQSEHSLRIGDLELELRHEKGETDDATVLWLPQKKILCTGDFFIWTSPNAGNPQKVQRYPIEWANALRRMAALEPEILLPGHGLPIIGAERVAQALDETARYLESLVEQVLELMNQGARLSDILQTVKPPADLVGRPYLKPLYDEPEFIIHNIWRLYGGWWDANPSTLQPASEKALAREISEIAGGTRNLAQRASALAAEGSDESLRLAGHLIEHAWLDSPSDEEIQQIRQEIYRLRAKAATSTMSRGVFNWAVRESTGEKL